MKVVLATGLWARLTGMLRKNYCMQGEVLMLAPCKSIHTFGMSCAIDIAFLDTDARILASERNLVSAQIRSHAKAVAVLERRSSPESFWPTAGEYMQLDCSLPMRTTFPLQKEGIQEWESPGGDSDNDARKKHEEM